MSQRIPPVFIGGSGRSGTTLVVDLLGLHPQLSPVYETDFVIALLDQLAAAPPGQPAATMPGFLAYVQEWASTLPHRPHTKRDHERYVHGPHHVRFDGATMIERTQQLASELEQQADASSVLAAARRYVFDLFEESARIDGKPSWINKTPGYVHRLRALHAMAPDMLFIHVVRDGRDAALSAMTRPWGPKTIDDAALWWRSAVLQGAAFGEQHPESYVEVRYEDMLHAPSGTLRRLLERIGVDADDDVVDQMLAGANEVDASIAGRWRRHPRQDELQRFTQLTRPLLERFDYATSTTVTTDR